MLQASFHVTPSMIMKCYQHHLLNVKILFQILCILLLDHQSTMVINGQMMISYGMRRLALSLNQFGLDMLRAVEQNTKHQRQDRPINKVYTFCPFCIGSSMAMLMTHLDPSQEPPGSESSSTTTESLYDSLRYALYVNSMQPQEINLAFLDLMRHLQVNLPDGFRIRRRRRRRQQNSDDQDLNQNHLILVNQMYIQRHLPYDYHYYLMMQQYFQTPVRTLDFVFAAEESRQHINAMVEHSTNGKIKDLIAANHRNGFSGNISSLAHTRLLFLSGLYFEGRLDLRQSIPSPPPPPPSSSSSQTLPNHRRRRGKRAAIFQRLWPIRSPFFQMPQIPPTMYHQQPVNVNHHQPTPLVSRPLMAGLQFKPWLAGTNLTAATASVTSTTGPSPSPKTTTMVWDSTETKLSTTMTTTTPSLIQTPPTIQSDYHHVFNPFQPFHSPSKQQQQNSRIITKDGIRLRYQKNEYLNATIVEMPFIGGIVSMLILLPDTANAMDLMLLRLNAQLVIDLLQTLEIQRVDITMPLINVSHSISDLKTVFNTMGLYNIFDDSENSGGSVSSRSFAGIHTFPLAHTMQIYHKTVLDIDAIDDANNDQIMGNFIETTPTKPFNKQKSEFHWNMGDSLSQSNESIWTRPSFEVTSAPMRIKVEPRHQPELAVQTPTNKMIRKKLFQINHPKRKQVNLEDEAFIYLIIDNISGLILAMGKHQT